MTIYAKIEEDDKLGSSKPISPPFTFRDPEDSTKIYGSAQSIKDLSKILNLIPYFSIEFHTYRIDEDMNVSSDLALWLKYVLGLSDLAEAVEQISQTYKGLKLKNKLIELFNAHIFAE